jgi:hypothetical protein
MTRIEASLSDEVTGPVTCSRHHTQIVRGATMTYPRALGELPDPRRNQHTFMPR